MPPSSARRSVPKDKDTQQTLDTISDNDGFELFKDLLMREEEGGALSLDIDMNPEMDIVEPSPASSVSSSNRKGVSPIYTDYSTDASHPSLGSARGIDSSSNQLIYSSSQTPHGFNVITKRKSTKKSVFNFEELDLSHLPTTQSSDPTSQAIAYSPIVDNPSSSEDSPEVVNRRILRTRPRNKTQQQEQQQLQRNQQDLHSFSEIENLNHLQEEHGEKNESMMQAEEFQEYDEDFKSQLETAGSLRGLTLDTEADFDWNLLCDSGALGAILQSPTPRNPRKKQDPGMRDTEDDIALSQDQTSYTMQEQQSFASFDGAAEYFEPPSSFSNDVAFPVYGSEQPFPNEAAAHNQHWQQPVNPVYDTSLYVKEEFPLSLPSISTLQANSTMLGSYSSQFSSVPSAPPVSDTNFPHDGPLSIGNITISNTALPLAAAMNEYHNMVNRKVQEMKYQQQQSQYRGMIVQNPPSYHHTGAVPTRTVSGPSSNTLTMQMQYTANISTNQHVSVSKRSSLASAASKKAPTVVAKTDSNDEDEDSNATAKKGSSSSSSRASKSLAEISRRFVTMYGKDNTMDYIAGLIDPDDITDAPVELYRVDSAADALGVHVRRIYELIKILEILSLVTFAGDKRGKFSWRGTKDFLLTLGSIQHDGIANFPQLAAQNGLVHPYSSPLEKPISDSSLSFKIEKGNRSFSRSNSADVMNQYFSETLDLDGSEILNIIAEDSPFKNAIRHTNFFEPNEPTPVQKVDRAPISVNHEEHFMVEIICRRFLQLFLVGMNSLSMSSAIQKLIPLESGQSLADYNKVNATKIRRVYDVTNVLCSLNLIKKKTIPKSKALKAEIENNIDSASVTDHSDITDDCESQSGSSVVQGRKGSGSKGSVGNRVGDRADTKVLEWMSFPPLVIRQKYLARSRQQLAQGKKMT